MSAIRWKVPKLDRQPPISEVASLRLCGPDVRFPVDVSPCGKATMGARHGFWKAEAPALMTTFGGISDRPVLQAMKQYRWGGRPLTASMCQIVGVEDHSKGGVRERD
jgi:hypothetical protein